MNLDLGPELLIGVVVAIVGAAGSFLVARVNASATEHSEITKRFDTLLDRQGNEIERLSKEVTELRTEFRKEQELTEALKEESTRWRGLLRLALAYLRALRSWEEANHPPPPPMMPAELNEWLWEDL